MSTKIWWLNIVTILVLACTLITNTTLLIRQSKRVEELEMDREVRIEIAKELATKSKARIEYLEQEKERLGKLWREAVVEAVGLSLELKRLRGR